MRLERIDDILAVLDGGLLSRADNRERLLTQTGMTRPVRTMEKAALSTTLFDRSRKRTYCLCHSWGGST